MAADKRTDFVEGEHVANLVGEIHAADVALRLIEEQRSDALDRLRALDDELSTTQSRKQRLKGELAQLLGKLDITLPRAEP